VRAERIRALGQYAPGTDPQYRSLVTVNASEAIPMRVPLLRELAADHATRARIIQVGLAAAHASADECTARILSG
jgi:starvation-inducible DNA-binding protein